MGMFEEVRDLFEQFKAANNERLTDIENRIDQDQAKRMSAGIMGGPTGSQNEDFRAFARSGVINNSMSVGSDPDGGYMVPVEIDASIASLQINQNPMRQLCTVLPVRTPEYKKLVSKRGVSSGWVGETDDRPETNTAKLAELSPFWGELYAAPKTTQRLLEDAFFQVEDWISGELADEFSYQEGNSFILGNGVNKPKGLLAYPTSADIDGVRDFGSIQHVVSGSAADFITATASASPADCLIDLTHSLKAAHRRNGVWMMNSQTLAKVRKFKDAVDGSFIWQPSITAGQPETILGYPVHCNEDMPNVGAGSLPISFGDMKQAYYIVDRVGWSILRDPYTSKGNVIFYCRKRVGSMLVNSEAVKLLKISA